MSATCPKCGAAIPAEAPQGLCPKCLLQQASFPTEAGPGTRHSRPAPPSRDDLTQAFPNLEILELIGQGGMGFVFKARQPKLDRLVALKILAQPLAEQTSFAERFTREGRTLAKLNHPNIVTIHDFGQAGPFFYLLMEFVDGVNLRQAMRAGAVNPAQALAIVPKICDALQYAHNEGVLHRDIKPDNILLDARGRVKIADFGIAKLMAEAAAENPLTGSGSSLGTPHYMAPEQIERPNTVDHRADIFSLGVVFYEMLTGELPLGRFAPPSEKSAIDPRLDKVVFQTLEKQPERRPQSADEVRTKVEDITAAPQPAASPAKPPPHVPPFRKIPLLVRVIAGAAVIALLVIFAVHTLERPSRHLHTLESAEPPPDLPAVSAIIPGASSRTIVIANAYSTNRASLSAVVTTEPRAGETFVPVIRYGEGPWGQSEATSVHQVWSRNEGRENYKVTFTWKLPEAFATAFEVAAAVVQTRVIAEKGPFEIGAHEMTPIFSISNSNNQSVACGLRLVKESSLQPTNPPMARLSKFHANYPPFNTLGDPKLVGTGFAEIPPGFRFQTKAFLDEEEKESSSESLNGYMNFHWIIPKYLASSDRQPISAYFEKLDLAPGNAREILSYTNYAGKKARFLLELVPMPQ